MGAGNGGNRFAARVLRTVATVGDKVSGGAAADKFAELDAMADELAHADPASLRQPDRQPEQAHLRSGAVWVAFGTNVATTAGKAVAAVLTGSAALFADTLHSIADTGTNLLLIVAQRRSRRPADLTHPYGYGGELFYWSLLAALGVFAAGGLLSIWDGVRDIITGGDTGNYWIGYTILGIGLATDIWSLSVATRELNRSAKARGIDRSQHLKTTTDTTTASVYLQELAAVLGGLLALAGLAGHQLTDSAIPDGLAAVAIGLLLAAVGIRLVRRNRDLLTMRANSPIEQDRIRHAVAVPDVAQIGRVISLIVGPHQMLVLAEIQPTHDINANPDGESLTRLVDELRTAVRQAEPRAVDVFIMPLTQVTPPPALDSMSRLDQQYWQRRFPEQD